ncbi:CheW protein [Methanospirillum hungatei JF-1]|uniref:CheW protein n=1 Tax=Methanospirillum hungatei JF-1 (strain ATCC 27890 / DSM 864 / NBRC 100397 / JF-1) TaxID=323259 RepID=Q2FQU1_METHJ|nr:chemotaxis protein CheW [Methanospirillum hungatei]ABD40743.1 CheW protein [Methanospirillum hungatei JF-1]
MVGTVGNPSFSQSSVCEDSKDILVFTVRNVRFGIPAVLLDHVIRMVAITPVDDPPRGIVGIINYHGDVLPVFSFRRYLSLDEKSPAIQDFLIIVKEERHMAIIAETISGVYHIEDEVISPEQLCAGMKGITGIYRCDDGLLIISHPKDLLGIEDQEKISAIREYLDL